MSLLMVAALLAADPIVEAQRPAILVPLVPPHAAAKASGDKLICHDMPMPGTRLVTQHMCGTAAQWADYKLVLQQDMQRVYQTNYGH